MELNQKMIVIIADGAAIQSVKADLSVTLADLRKKVNANHYIKNKLTYSLLFVSDGQLIDSGKEPQTKLKDILVADQYEVHLNSKLNSINILINQKNKHTKSVPLAFSLSSLRNLDPKLFPLHLNFFKNDKIIRLTDESRIKISDILVNNTVHIQQADPEKHTAFEAEDKEQEQQEQTESNGKRKQEIEQKVEIMKFNILINRQKQIISEFDVSKTLRALRESKNEIAASMDFSWKNGPIYEEDETEIKISDILDEPIQSAHTIINKQKKSSKNLKDTVNVLWIAEKYEKLKNDPEFNKNQTEFQEKGTISKYLNLNSIDINVLPKGFILDPDGNPADSSYDLGIDGMFTKFKILIGLFYHGIEADLRSTAMLALKGKGFTVDLTKTESEFAQKLPEYDQGWIISTNTTLVNQNEVISAIQKHLAQKKGLLIWADNEPLFQQANVALAALNLKIPIQLTGNDHGAQMLERIFTPKATQKSFIQHQITTGIFKMNEDLRKKVNANHYIKNKLTYSLLFVSDGQLIDSGKEPQTKLKDILVADQYEVHLNSKLNSINILINQKNKHTKSVPLAFSLSSLRNLDPKLFPLHLNFFKNDKIIRLTDESRIKISDILVNNTVHIQQADPEKHTAFEAEDKEQEQQEQTKSKAIKGKGKGKGKQEIEQKVEIMKFNILIDRQKQIISEFDVSKTLRALRESKNEIAASMDFSWKNGPIYEEDETEIKISDILDEPIQSAHTIINKQKKSSKNLKDTVNVLWIAEKYEKLKNDPEFNKNQTEFQEKGTISKYLNLNSIDINVLPKGFILDPDGNPADSSYDLGIDGMFTKFKILIGLFYHGIEADLRSTAMLALKGKGFTVDLTKTESEFAQKLPEYDQGWIISTNTPLGDQIQFISAIQKHLAQKKGLLIWADNEPYFQQANVALTAVNLKVPIRLTGDDRGTKMLERIMAPKATQQSFIQHQISTGIFKMNEGITICYPVNDKTPSTLEYGELEVIGVGSAGRPSYMCLEGTESRGRIIIDCGFTKLMPGWWNGNWRYVRNCAVWLLWLEYQLKDK